MRWSDLRIRALLVSLALASSVLAVRAETTETVKDWLQRLWPEAEAVGVSRATFDKAFQGFTPDLSLPDLDLPSRASNDARGQAEFTRSPAEYLDKAYLSRLATDGKALLAKHRQTLEKIEHDIGVDRYSVLAIWGRETSYGTQKDPYDAITVLATEAYVGRRKDLFRTELIAALRMLQEGVPRKLMRSSWAGAMGLTQFMPSEYFKHAHDLNGDGKADIWNSVPDALASAARQLAGKGWVRGQVWGHEVGLTPAADCAYEGPTQERPVSEWVKLGLKRADGKPWTDTELSTVAYLMSPAGGYGPSFLVFENYKVIRRYNTSDLYAVFVGNLADRIAGGGDFKRPFGGTGPQKTAVIEEIQERLKGLGYEVEKIDGKVGSNTRKVIGLYERANKLKVDCWPSDAVLAHMRQSAMR
jgi:lytic murein transglycosylase